jgi:DnaD/phage-associated family protein
MYSWFFSLLLLLVFIQSSLDFDENKNLIGIHLECIQATEPTKITGSVSAPVAPVTMATAPKVPATDAPVAVAPIVHIAPVEAEPDFTKPAYSADQLKAFKAQENAAQLLFIAETYVGKALSVNDIKTIYYMSDVLHFSDDLIDYLIQYCVERGKKDFRYIRKVAENWASLGIMTPAQAESAPEQVSEDKGRKAAGRRSSGRSSRSSARALSTEAGGRSDAGPAADADTSAGSGRKPRRTRGGNAFNQFEQNSYDFDALEEELLQS